jgi:hypothetical protein
LDARSRTAGLQPDQRADLPFIAVKTPFVAYQSPLEFDT